MALVEEGNAKMKTTWRMKKWKTRWLTLTSGSGLNVALLMGLLLLLVPIL